MAMNFSVLISIYIKEDPSFLIKAMDSIFKQTMSPSEVILVKDGPLTQSLDKIIEDYVATYSFLKIVSLPENKGLGYALNEGLKHCSNNLVARMDTDDICCLDRFEKQIKIFEKHPNLSFVGTGIAEFEITPDQISGYRIPPRDHQNIIKFAKKKSPLNHATVMYKKDAVLSVGGYKEFPEDYHLWVRALMKGYQFYNIQEPLLNVRFNLKAIKRRSGLSYIKTELKHQKEFYSLGFLTRTEYFYNCVTRVGVRIMPNKIKGIIYSNILRQKKIN